MLSFMVFNSATTSFMSPLEKAASAFLSAVAAKSTRSPRAALGIRFSFNLIERGRDGRGGEEQKQRQEHRHSA